MVELMEIIIRKFNESILNKVTIFFNTKFQYIHKPL